MKAGFTPEQQSLLAQRWCGYGHRFDGINFPTPDGVCPRCAYPEVGHDIDRYQRDVVERSAQPREPHQSVGLVEQLTPAALSASER